MADNDQSHDFEVFKAELVAELQRQKAELDATINQQKIDQELALQQAQQDWEVRLEQWRAERQGQIEHYRATVSSELELFRSVINYGSITMKGLFLINGGAAAALLAFVGHLATSNPPRNDLAAALAGSMSLFLWGLAIAVLTSFLSYIAQSYYAHQKDMWGAAFQGITLAVGIVSGGMFMWGALDALAVFRSMSG